MATLDKAASQLSCKVLVLVVEAMLMGPVRGGRGVVVVEDGALLVVVGMAWPLSPTTTTRSSSVGKGPMDGESATTSQTGAGGSRSSGSGNGGVVVVVGLKTLLGWNL